mgnify:CR=1 FL=1
MLDRVKELREEYLRLLHAMQTGVAFDPDTSDREPKHLRVGVNAAMADQGALAGLLIAKGIFTEEEYVEALVAGMQREVDGYEQKLSKKFSKPVHLA